jgi:hypothetical protein
MSFIQRELDKINEAIRNAEADSIEDRCLHAAQQALVWALEPDGYASPSMSLHRAYGVPKEGTQGTGLNLGNAAIQPAPAH